MGTVNRTMSVVVAANAEPGVPYRPRRRVGLAPTCYLTAVSPKQARAVAERLLKRWRQGAILGTELTQLRGAQKALAGDGVLLRMHRRGRTDNGKPVERTRYVGVPLDYELKPLKTKPGYG